VLGNPIGPPSHAIHLVRNLGQRGCRLIESQAHAHRRSQNEQSVLCLGMDPGAPQQLPTSQVANCHLATRKPAPMHWVSLSSLAVQGNLQKVPLLSAQTSKQLQDPSLLASLIEATDCWGQRKYCARLLQWSDRLGSALQALATPLDLQDQNAHCHRHLQSLA